VPVRRTLAIVALALALPGSALAAAPAPPLGHHGRWLTDATGRVVILHGVNMVYKRPPYAPSAAGFNRPDAAFLRRHGFNSVRLGVIYEGVEPKPGHYDNRYLAKIAATERILAAHGIYSLLDFHQDLYSEKFTGEGFPPWAVLDDGQPTQPLTGFPATYITSPGENAAWNNLWADAGGPKGVGLQERYAAAWKHVANRFRTLPRVLGYDLINEPWPGSVWPTCANLEGCPGFEQGSLAPMEEKAIHAIRQVDDNHIVWYEPVVTSQFGPKLTIPDMGDPNAGLSFHDYCLPGALGTPGLSDKSCRQLERLSLDNAQARARANGDTLLLSEFGATADKAAIKRMTNATDERMLSWQWWHYCPCGDPTTSGPGNAQALVKNPKQPPTGKNVLHHKLALLDRPYPQAVGGTPLRYSFHRASSAFRFRYSTTAPGGSRLPRSVKTVVYIPKSHYKQGYRAKVSGARVVSGRDARHVVLERAKGASTVKLSVLPSG
jgi:endoglycosylceramidase